jgi:dihydroorotase
VVPAAALTIGTDGAVLSPHGELAELGVRLFSDSSRAVQDPAVFRRALEYLGGVAAATGRRLVAAQRVHDDALVGPGVMHEGSWSARLGLPGMPAVAEELMVDRTIALARLTGTPVHLQQLSTAAAVDAVRAAKADGVPVTAEVSPHHLVLDHEALASYDPNLKVAPPVRTPRDREALVNGVADGTIDAIATDHHPHTMDAKERPFDQAPFGVLGLETALAVLMTETPLGLERLVAALSWQPASVAGLADHGGPIVVGRPANLTVVDPDQAWTVGIGSFGGYAANSPFLGRRLTGRVRHTIHRGRAVVVDGSLVDPTPASGGTVRPSIASAGARP